MKRYLKQFLGFLILLLIIENLNAQNPYLNQQKYWYMRHRFNQKFIKVGPGHGESLPAALYEIIGEECWNRNSDINKKLWFGSETTGRLGFYIGVLATELKLLIDNGENYDETVMELYYALNAIDRLDDYGELILDYQVAETQGPPPPSSDAFHCNDCALSDASGNPRGNATWDSVSQHWIPKPGSHWNSSNSRNGYFVRNDAPPGFISNFPDANIWVGGVTRPWNPTVGGFYDFGDLCTFGLDIGNPGDIPFYSTNLNANGGMETSQDQIFALLMGLKLVKQFVPSWVNYYGNPLRDKAIGIGQRLVSIFGTSYSFVSPVTNAVPCNDGTNAFFFSSSVSALQQDFFADITNNANTQALLPGELFCTGSYDQAVSHHCLYSMISAIANTNPHEDFCQYVSNNGYNWEFYYLLRQALYPHAPNGGCDYTIDEINTDLDLCPCRGPHLDIYEWTEDGTYKTNGEWNAYTLSETQLNAPIPWSVPNRYEKACYLPDGNDWTCGSTTLSRITNSKTGEFSGIDYMLLYNLACIVHGDENVGTPYTNMQHYYLTNPIPWGAYSPVGFIDMTTDVILEYGNSVHTKAAESIELLPGFDAKPGCYFEAEIRDGQWSCVNYEYRRIPFTPSPQTESSLSNKSPDNFQEFTDSMLIENKPLSVYPNPTFSSLTIRTKNSSIELINITCYDINGKEVLSSVNNASMYFDMSDLKAGYYNIRVEYVFEDQTKTEFFKVIKL